MILCKNGMFSDSPSLSSGVVMTNDKENVCSIQIKFQYIATERGWFASPR